MTGKNLKMLGALALLALALTGCGSDSTPSPTAVVDTAPPAVPADVNGVTYSNTVQLEWAANTTDADLAGYKVYRVSGERVAALTAVAQVENYYTDTNPSQGSNDYRVTSVDVNGNESAYEAVQVTVDDDFGPYHPDTP
mgnify:CR=1 FL=1